MIADLARFLEAERPFWRRLEDLLDRRERDAAHALTFAEARDYHYLYQRASADLARLANFAGGQEIRREVESLVARAYADIHAAEHGTKRLRPLRWLTRTLPRTFRRQFRPFLLALAVFMFGSLVGGAALHLDPDCKSAIVPFDHILGDPSQRVAEEEKEQSKEDGEARKLDGKTFFASGLMRNNISVAFGQIAFGMTWGAGTFIGLFYNGLILGVVAADYLRAGEGVFLAGWLLPHGVIEIPALVLGGQAGFVLAGAMIGRGSRLTFAERFRAVTPDVVTLAAGVALMLVWAGLVESFLSQYHEPLIPYAVKIFFGIAELAALFAFLALAGRPTVAPASPA